MMARYGEHGHTCEYQLKFGLRMTTKLNDTIVYCKDKHFHRLTDLGNETDRTFYGSRIPTLPYEPDEDLLINFQDVGVAMMNPDQAVAAPTAIPQSDIIGKGIIVPTSQGEAVVSLPRDFLLECC